MIELRKRITKLLSDGRARTSQTIFEALVEELHSDFQHHMESLEKNNIIQRRSRSHLGLPSEYTLTNYPGRLAQHIKQHHIDQGQIHSQALNPVVLAAVESGYQIVFMLYKNGRHLLQADRRVYYPMPDTPCADWLCRFEDGETVEPFTAEFVELPYQEAGDYLHWKGEWR